MQHHYRITQTFEIAVDDETAFLEWGDWTVDVPENPQSRVTVGLGNVVGQSLRGIPGVRMRNAHTSVHRFEPEEG